MKRPSMGYCIICPFYIADKKSTISCEDTIHIFYGGSDKKNWMKEYCRSNWRQCRFAECMNQIYESEERMSDWMKKAKIEEQKASAARRELKNLNTEYGKRVAEYKQLLTEKNAHKKAAEHIVTAKTEQISELQGVIEGYKQLGEIKDTIIACLMRELNVNSFDTRRVKQFREQYDLLFSGSKDDAMVIELHLESK